MCTAPQSLGDNYPYREHGLLRLRTPAEIVRNVDVYIVAHPDRLDEIFVAHLVTNTVTTHVLTTLIKAGWRIDAGHFIGADFGVPAPMPYVGSIRTFSIERSPLLHAQSTGNSSLTQLLLQHGATPTPKICILSTTLPLPS